MVAARRPVSPGEAFSCADSGWLWLGVARILPLLAPSLAPKNLLASPIIRIGENIMDCVSPGYFPSLSIAGWQVA